MRLAAALAICLVSACAGASHELVAPGTYAISCKRSQSNCWKRANQVCPNGYDQLDGSQRSGTYLATNTQTGSVTAYPVFNGEMLVRCR